MKALSAAFALPWLILTIHAAEMDPGFTPLMDGETFAGWRFAEENTNTWTIRDGAFVAHGSRSHLFYVGDGRPFQNFHLKVEVMTEPNSNGGIYFHTEYQAVGWPKAGFESQVNNTHGDWKKTGSLYDVVNVSRSLAKDNQWWTQEIIVLNRKVTIKVDGMVLLEYTQPDGARAGRDFERVFGEGTFALQGHDPGSTVRYRNIRVKRL